MAEVISRGLSAPLLTACCKINGVLQNATSDWTAAGGTYTVNPNCTGTAVVNTPYSPVPLHLDFVIVTHGSEIRTVLETNAISTVFKKVE